MVDRMKPETELFYDKNGLLLNELLLQIFNRMVLPNTLSDSSLQKRLLGKILCCIFFGFWFILWLPAILIGTWSSYVVCAGLHIVSLSIAFGPLGKHYCESSIMCENWISNGNGNICILYFRKSIRKSSSNDISYLKLKSISSIVWPLTHLL